MAAGKRSIATAEGQLEQLEHLERLILKPGSPLTNNRRRGRGGGARATPRSSRKRKSTDVISISDDDTGDKADDTVQLEPGDTMFKQPSGTTRVERSVSPVRTRSASGVFKKRKLLDDDEEVNDVQALPKEIKKRKLLDDDEEVNDVQAPPKEPVGTQRKTRKNAKKDSTVETNKDTVAKRLASIERLLALHRALSGVPAGQDATESATDVDDGEEEDEYDLEDPFIDDSEALDRPSPKKRIKRATQLIDDSAIEDNGDQDIESKSKGKGKQRREPSEEWDMSQFDAPDGDVQRSPTIGEEEEAKMFALAIKASLESGRSDDSTMASTSKASIQRPLDPSTHDSAMAPMSSIQRPSEPSTGDSTMTSMSQVSVQRPSDPSTDDSTMASTSKVSMQRPSDPSTNDVGNALPVLPGLSAETIQALLSYLAKQPQPASPLGPALLPSPVLIPEPSSGLVGAPTPLSPHTPVRPTFGKVVPKAAATVTGPPTARTFGQVAPPGTIKKTVTQGPNPKDIYRVLALPEKCEVTDLQLQDELLVAKYVGLPNLKAVKFVSWNQNRGPGQIVVSSFGESLPHMEYGLFEKAVDFVRCGQFIGPARASPLLTHAVRTTPDGFKMSLYLDEQPAVLISTMYVKASHLLEPSGSPISRKSISGIGFTQEWERQVSFLGMVFGYDTLHAQVALDVLTYSTKGVAAEIADTDKKHFSPHKSPSIKLGSGSRKTPLTSADALDCTDTVPVYDARGSDFDFDTDLPNVASKLPVVESEVPEGSCVTVAYTANVYKSKSTNQWNIACNVRFVIVLAVP